MLYDFPTPPTGVKSLLYADDITIYTSSNFPTKSESVIQPYLDDIIAWGFYRKCKFSPTKSAVLPLNRSLAPVNGPTFLINGQPLPSVLKFKFLGLIFDHKLLWRDHINSIIHSCLRLKSLFFISCKSNYAPSIPNLSTLSKCLIRSKIDYGLTVYGSARRSSLHKIDIAARPILRIILGSKTSTTIEWLNLDTGTEHLIKRRRLPTHKYLLNLSYHPNNSSYASTRLLFLSHIAYRPKSIPCIIDGLTNLKLLKFWTPL